ncbi:uncharacterized protein LOC143236794 [Tachypleus tridentatus]|uniref:uncharacterized protein LOC143236794 n=1 Tax=Tachypleus tridentatus TaxID=6853 RepID=UPI003FCF497F
MLHPSGDWNHDVTFTVHPKRWPVMGASVLYGVMPFSSCWHPTVESSNGCSHLDEPIDGDTSIFDVMKHPTSHRPYIFRLIEDSSTESELNNRDVHQYSEKTNSSKREFSNNKIDILNAKPNTKNKASGLSFGGRTNLETQKPVTSKKIKRMNRLSTFFSNILRRMNNNKVHPIRSKEKIETTSETDNDSWRKFDTKVNGESFNEEIMIEETEISISPGKIKKKTNSSKKEFSNKKIDIVNAKPNTRNKATGLCFRGRTNLQTQKPVTWKKMKRMNRLSTFFNNILREKTNSSKKEFSNKKIDIVNAKPNTRNKATGLSFRGRTNLQTQKPVTWRKMKRMNRLSTFFNNILREKTNSSKKEFSNKKIDIVNAKPNTRNKATGLSFRGRTNLQTQKPVTWKKMKRMNRLSTFFNNILRAGSHTKEEFYENSLIESRSHISIPQAVNPLASMYRSTSVPSAFPFSDSPHSARSVPWEGSKPRGLYSSSTNPSPRSAKSATSHIHLHQRSASTENGSSCDFRRRRHHHSRKSSDNESEVSKSSRGSKTSKSSKHSSSNRRSHYRDGTSGSESEDHKKHKKHHRRDKSGSTYELVDSEAQWKVVQQQQLENCYFKPQSAVVRDLSSRKSGYHNSGMETESEATFIQKKKHRRHRSRSKSPENKRGLSDELKKHIKYTLIDPENLTEHEKQDIKYTKVESDSRLVKVRYSPTSGQAYCRVARLPLKNSSEQLKSKVSAGGADSPPPPYAEGGPVLHENSQMLTHAGGGFAMTTQPNHTKVSDNQSKHVTSILPSNTYRHNLSVPLPGTSMTHSNRGFVQTQMIKPQINHSFLQNQSLNMKSSDNDNSGSQTKLQCSKTSNGITNPMTAHLSPHVSFKTSGKTTDDKSFPQFNTSNPLSSKIANEVSKTISGSKIQLENNLEMSTEL